MESSKMKEGQIIDRDPWRTGILVSHGGLKHAINVGMKSLLMWSGGLSRICGPYSHICLDCPNPAGCTSYDNWQR